jgi:hypothetical protein
MVGIKQAIAAGAFDTVTGDVERVSGASPTPAKRRAVKVLRSFEGEGVFPGVQRARC